MAYTLKVGRKPLRFRDFSVCDREGEPIISWQRCHSPETFVPQSDPPVGIIFPREWEGAEECGLELYQCNTIFRQCAGACFDAIENHGSPKCLRGELDGRNSWEHCENQRMRVFVIEYSLARTWLALGIEPKIAMGAGVGRLVLECLLGQISLRDALKMLREGASDTLPAENRSFEFFATGVRRRDGSGRGNAVFVPVPLTDFEQSDGRTQTPSVLQKHEGTVFVAMGSAEQIFPPLVATQRSTNPATIISIFRREAISSEMADFLCAIGTLWKMGVPLSWDRLHDGQRRRRVPLPQYPFERSRVWWEDAVSRTNL